MPLVDEFKTQQMKKSVVGVFSDHHQAVEAAKSLIDQKFSKEDISIVGRMEDVKGDVHLPVVSNMKHAKPVAIGSAVGAVTGILTGIGIFAVPGLGFLYGAGALVGAIAGFDFGLITGGLVSFTETLTDEKHKHSLAEYLQHNHHMLVYTVDEKDKVRELLQSTSPEDIFH